MSVVVELTRPLKAGQTGEVKKLEFREPKFADYMVLGDPRVPVPSGEDDKVYMRPIPERVGQYAERLLIGGDNTLLGAICLRDTLAVQAAITGFFRDAESVPATPKTSSSESAAS